MEAKQYVPRDRNSATNPFTLLLAHGSASHKETWELSIARLLQHQSKCPGEKPIREVRSVEWPSHGQSAVLNRLLLQHSGVVISGREWAIAIADFCRRYLRGHRVICIGHSAGAYTLLNTTKALSVNDGIPYECMVLIEPAVCYRHIFEINSEQRMLHLRAGYKYIQKRRGEWASRPEAFSWMTKRAPWNAWDPRVLRLYTEHALENIRKGEDAVALKCPAQTEAQICLEADQITQAMDGLEAICSHIPVHVMFGEYNDLVPAYYNDCVTNLRNGYKVASVTVMPGTGHLILQERPDGLADYLWQIILKHAVKLPMLRDPEDQRPLRACL